MLACFLAKGISFTSLTTSQNPTLWPSPGWNFVFSHSLLTPLGDKTLGLQGICAWGAWGWKVIPFSSLCFPLVSCQAASQPLINQPRPQPAYQAALADCIGTGTFLLNPSGLSHHRHAFLTILSLSYFPPFYSLALTAALTVISGTSH